MKIEEEERKNKRVYLFHFMKAQTRRKKVNTLIKINIKIEKKYTIVKNKRKIIKH